jgi:hypothetical protein
MRIELIAALLVLTAVTGCTTISKPVMTGRDTYLLTVHGFPGTTPQAAGIEQAGQFCQSQGKVIQVLAENTWRTPDPRAEIQFACVAADKQQPGMLRKDNGVTTIENH